MSTHPPITALVERNKNIVSLEGANITDMISALVYDMNPAEDPLAIGTALHGLFADHYNQLDAEALGPGRPAYYRFMRGASNLTLWPRADRTYWVRAVFRAPVGTKASVDA